MQEWHQKLGLKVGGARGGIETYGGGIACKCPPMMLAPIVRSILQMEMLA